MQDDPRGERIFWIGPVGKSADDKEGTDFHAIANKLVSVTPIEVDMTQHTNLTHINDWLLGDVA